MLIYWFTMSPITHSSCQSVSISVSMYVGISVYRQIMPGSPTPFLPTWSLCNNFTFAYVY